MSLISRLAVIGAGSVGTSLAYAALIRRSASEVILYDIDAAKTEAEVLDLAHGTQFTGTSKVSGGGDISCVAGASVVVITAGAKQKPGQTRLELAGTNVAILESLMPRLAGARAGCGLHPGQQPRRRADRRRRPDRRSPRGSVVRLRVRAGLGPAALADR